MKIKDLFHLLFYRKKENSKEKKGKRPEQRLRLKRKLKARG